MQVKTDNNSSSFLAEPYSCIAVDSGSGIRQVPIIKRSGTQGVGLFSISGLGGSLHDPNTKYFERKAQAEGYGFVAFAYSEFNGTESIIRDFDITRMFHEGFEVFRSQTEGPQVIVALSFGANIALKLLEAFPDRVKAVVLGSTGVEVVRDLIQPTLAGDAPSQLRRRERYEKTGECLVPVLYHSENGERIVRTIFLSREAILAGVKSEVFHNKQSITVRSPVIIIHDPYDTRIPISSSEDLRDKIIIEGIYKEPRHPRLHRAYGAGHDHNERAYDQKLMWIHVDRLLSSAAADIKPG